MQNFEEALRISGSSASNDLAKVQQLFVGNETLTVSKLVTKIQKQLGTPEHNESSEAIARVQQLLKVLGELLGRAGARGVSADVAKFGEVLIGRRFESIGQLLEHLAQSANEAVAPNTGDPLRTDVVNSHLEALKMSESHNAEFDRNISALKADKRVRTLEMREIAKQFLGFEIAKKKGRAPALQEIINHQTLDARQAARASSHRDQR